ncbi:efflux RND transporter periplasmic adaptor subunit [Limnohabitans sp. Rim8]|jgi:cobalt-zinc-cadmium efflux system membrane fusion protein|uniref:efflux RND transporter periplasmic adaptor subunit n=1 Tax=Limnohabitans sp. Rim8 TaxID=1100718 RepID=UPI0026333B25|nr:efflux RND transporter periplasmic adaptor subunit [Limnohabitans sp. Rim8]
MKTYSLTLQPVLLSLVIASSSLVLLACGEKKTAPNTAVKTTANPMDVTLQPEMANQFKVEKLEVQETTPWIEVAGRIEANDRLVTRIGASVTGRVTEVLAEVGDRVRSGQALARVASSELTTAQLGYLRAHSAASQAERGVERARQLIQADVIGSAELQRRESELAIARAELRAAGDQLKLMGLYQEAIDKLREQGTLHAHAAVSATLAGVVIERKVSHGQVVQPGDPLFTVADLGNVWVVGALPEQTARLVETGQSVDIEVPALGNRQISGKIVYVGDTVSAETRSVTIRTQVDNSQRDLKPQMLATMRIRGNAQKSLALPSLAVVRENDKDHVYVKLSDRHFRLTPIELGMASGAWRPVLKGLPQGTEIVTDGAFHLNNERKRAELE